MTDEYVNYPFEKFLFDVGGDLGFGIGHYTKKNLKVFQQVIKTEVYKS
mgnify:CR=1|jgi:hypothetical protein